MCAVCSNQLFLKGTKRTLRQIGSNLKSGGREESPDLKMNLWFWSKTCNGAYNAMLGPWGILQKIPYPMCLTTPYFQRQQDRDCVFLHVGQTNSWQDWTTVNRLHLSGSLFTVFILNDLRNVWEKTLPLPDRCNPTFYLTVEEKTDLGITAAAL